MAEPKAKTQKPTTVTVISKFDRFVDQVMNKEITKVPTIVEMHPWLAANIEAGLVIVVEQ